jgi:two-component system response regulator DesR
VSGDPVRTYGAGAYRSNGLESVGRDQNLGVSRTAMTVLVAVRSAEVREALVAMLGTLDGFRVVAEASSDEQAVDLARSVRPHLALVEQEMSGAGGCWAIQTMRSEQLVQRIIALGRRADSVAAQRLGARAYVQMGASPREFLLALEQAIGG